MINYPFLPEKHQFKFVTHDHPFMVIAELARRECSGDSLYPVGAILVKDGNVVARAGNGFNRGSGIRHVCPRVVQECPSGTGYELCSLHDSPGHAEAMLLNVAREQGIDPNGCDVYLFGHWWCCEPCWNVMIDSGIRDVYLVNDANVRFSRDRVYSETLSGKRTDVRMEQDGNTYKVFVPESIEPVFTFETDSHECAERYFKNVISQL